MVSEHTTRRLKFLEDVLRAIDYGYDIFDSESCVLPERACNAPTLDGEGLVQVGVRFRVVPYGRGVRVLYNSAEVAGGGRWDEVLLDLPVRASRAWEYRDKLATALAIKGWEE